MSKGDQTTHHAYLFKRVPFHDSAKKTGIRGFPFDMVVPLLLHDNKPIQNPRPTRELQANDRLLFFGKLDSIRKPVPVAVRGKRRPKLKSLPE